MKMNIVGLVCALLTAGALIVATPQGAKAEENDQTIVGGITLFGFGTTTGQDDIRKIAFGGDTFTQVSGIYIEWNLFDRLGLTYRNMYTGTFEEGTIGGVDYVKEISTVSHILGASFVPWISPDGYRRLIVLGGWGPSTYTYTASIATASNSVSTSGSALMAQAAMDWGGEDFGARIGYGLLLTSYDPMKVGGTSYSVDDSNSHLYIDLRWAFK